MYEYLIVDCEMCSEKCAVLGEGVLMWLLEVEYRQSRKAPQELALDLRFGVGWETARRMCLHVYVCFVCPCTGVTFKAEGTLGEGGR